ncbi:hypothetical protein GGR56DRAFT_667179 [Xylariaceae sp. FL0804]|nr:hypothetical protein GGR56DRAFT_667179 [Xylariaceae sp. FL0804]
MSPVTPNLSSSASSSPVSTTNMTTMPTSDMPKAGKRKGTRSVSTLTPSQLARKRANDREAQRAIRARTKEHIENLEREIDELRSRQNRDQTVQDLLRRNKALEDEVRRLRDGMGVRSSGTSGPYQSRPAAQAHNSPATYQDSSTRGSPFGHSSTPEYPMVPDIAPYNGMHDTSDTWPSSLGCSVPSTVSSPASSGGTSAGAEDFGNNYYPTSAPSGVLERGSMPPGMNSPTVSCIGSDGFEDIKPAARIRMPAAHQLRAGNVQLSSSALDHVPRVLPSLPSGAMMRPPGASYWEVPILNTPRTPHADAVISQYISDRRRLLHIAGGRWYQQLILGPSHPNVRPVIQAYEHQLAGLNLQGTPQQRTGLLLLFKGLITWIIQPSRSAYLGLGEILRPQPSQVSVPHSQWIDLLLWPRLRDAFFHLYMSCLRLRHWRGGFSRAFSVEHSTGSVYARPEFAEHAWNLNNWALHENFLGRYPELGNLVTIDRPDCQVT